MKRLSIAKTIYPIGYDKNNNKSDKSFNNWHMYIRAELSKIPPMQKVIIEVKKILNTKKS